MLRVARLRVPTCPCPCRSRSTTQKSWMGPRFATVSSTSMCEPFSSCPMDGAACNTEHATAYKHRTCNAQRTTDRPRAHPARWHTLRCSRGARPSPGTGAHWPVGLPPGCTRAVLVVGRVRVGRVRPPWSSRGAGCADAVRMERGWDGMVGHAVAYRLGFELQQLRVAECRPDEDDGRVEVPATVTRSCIM